MKGHSTAARAFNIADVEQEIEDAMRNGPHPARQPTALARYEPPLPMPSYLEHREGADEIGKLSAEAVGKSYEAAAREIEAMGAELKERLDKLEATKVDVVAAMGEIKETAASFREAGKLIFLQIEDCALMTAEVRGTCTSLKAKIAGPSS